MTTQIRATERTATAPGRLALDVPARAFLLPALITILVVVGAFFGPPALTVGASGAPATGARLDVGWAYVLMAPIANVLDTLSVLALEQHYAVLATLALAYLVWRVARRPRPHGVRGRRALRELGAAVVALLGLLGFYAYGILGPRPMAALVPADDDVLVVDVHSHTHHSHDARRGFDAADRRAWHRAAGFDAVYVADHRTWDGYLEGATANPERAGEGTVLLPALEITYQGKYASVLGEPERYRRAADGNILLPDTLERLTAEVGRPPTLVLTIPGPVGGVEPAGPDGLGFVALELSDASPRGLRQSRRDRARLVRLADSLDLALVAATNNHGWGRTAAAWTLMRIPGWSALAPHELGAAIEDKIHRDRRRASWVVERPVPWFGGRPHELLLSVPAIAWGMFGGMGPAERVSWLVWTWALAFAALFRPNPLRRLAKVGGVRHPSR